MERFQRILVAVDTRYERHPVLDQAAHVARYNGASLKIMDVVPDYSWPLRVTSKSYAEMQEQMHEEKLRSLEELAAPIRASGLEVSLHIGIGRTSTEVIREAIRGNHDLVMRVAKGVDSRRKGFFGATGMQLLRKCPCPLWLVTPLTSPEFKHILACIDTSSTEEVDAQLNAQIMEFAQSISRYNNGRYSVLHAWSIWNESMLRSRLGESQFEEIEQATLHHVSKSFESFLRRYDVDPQGPNARLIKGDASEVIPSFVHNHGVDLVIMGTVARSGIGGLLVGNTAEGVLSQIACSVLAMKPRGFVSPVIEE